MDFITMWYKTFEKFIDFQKICWNNFMDNYIKSFSSETNNAMFMQGFLHGYETAIKDSKQEKKGYMDPAHIYF